MDKYTKTINELKKEYRNLKLSNTHNKSANNKLINGGMDTLRRWPGYQDDKVKLDDIPDYTEHFYYNDNNFVFPRENKNYIVMNCMIYYDTDFI